MKQKLYILSLIGWSLTAVTMLLTLFRINLVGKFPFLLILFPGIFVVLIPCILYAKNNERIVEYEYDNDMVFSSGSIPLIPFFEKLPNWIIGMLGLSFMVAIICLSKSFNAEGTGQIINNKYFLTNHGNVIKEISKIEYENNKLLNIRGFFGLAMLFYAIAILVYKKLIEWENSDAE